MIEGAMALTDLSKLGEAFFENLPQFLTLIVMTSAKGNEGERVLSKLQWLLVISSAASMAMRMSGHILSTHGTYMSKIHTKLA